MAIVTGASGGIGSALCQSMVSNGYVVCGIDLSPSAIDCDFLDASSNGEYHHYSLDISIDSDVRDCVGQIIARFGRIDALVNNAGWDRYSLFEDTCREDWERIVGINMFGYLSFMHSVLPHMKKTGGVMIGVASDAARIGSIGESVYAACKASLIGFSKSLAREVARFNIKVNVVCPGPTETKLLTDVLAGMADPERAAANFIKSIPLRRFGKPSDISAVINFLLSDGAEYMTGQVISISGGLTMVD